MISGIWNGEYGLSADYTVDVDAAECLVDAIYKNGVECNDFLDVLEANGVNVYERIQERILEGQKWKD